MKYRIIEEYYKGNKLYRLEKKLSKTSRVWSWKYFKFIDSIHIKWETINYGSLENLKALINELEFPPNVKVVYQQ